MPARMQIATSSGTRLRLSLCSIRTRSPFFRSSPASSPLSSLGLLLLLSTCLFSMGLLSVSHHAALTVAAADSPLTRQQIYDQEGFVKNWIAPMPNAPIAAAGANDPSGMSGERFIVQNWSTNYKSIPVGGNGLSFVSDPFSGGSSPIVSGNKTTGPVLQLLYPKGSYAPSRGTVQGGAQFYASPFGESTPYSKMMISYDVAFPAGFNWVLGGKLPGVYGGSPKDGCSGGKTSADCLTVRLMWREVGHGEVYAYIPTPPSSNFCKDDQVMCNDKYGISVGRGMIYFTAGVWSHIDVVMELNEPASKQNGKLKVYLDGNRVITMDNVPYRTTGMVGFQGLMFSSFFGGADPSYATPVDTSVYFKNLQMSVGEPATLYEGKGSGASHISSARNTWIMLFTATLSLLLTMVV